MIGANGNPSKAEAGWPQAVIAGAFQTGVLVVRSLVRRGRGLVGYWRLDDGNGTTATDSGPLGLPARLFDGTAWVSGGPIN